ncbi:maleylpyruvate isomerase family mycothiol-dependent enzyme [Actinoplanes sp. NPDC023936]|uniref:maleylpyruvate isomerase family mycothiol-dependent enzyme n=1 Tax=Actinoplanes sp. NPDC023936 TaxID=3154910 RepID=UPI0033C06E77
MASRPPFPELLSLIESRSAALREAAVDLTAQVPGCPGWTVRDLVTHVGRVQRFWASAVRAGAAAGPPPAPGDPSGELLIWFDESTPLLVDALRAAGPGAPSWAWWPPSAAPHTVGAIARHQVQEAAVHAFDAQEAIGKPEPLPAAVAVDGVGEFLEVCLGSRGAWPHRPARVELQALEGPSWTVDLSPAGVTVDPAASGAPVTRMQGRASDLVLALYRRIGLADVRVDGDREVAEQIREWCVVD